jgi:NTE family protein
MKNSVKAECPKAIIGLALGGGFARGIAHVGVLRVLERNGIPVDRITGVSAGAIVAGAYASGTGLDELADIALRMKVSDIASLNLSRLAFATTARMTTFLRRILKGHRFEDMRIPFSTVATDLAAGEPVVFSGRGDVITPIRSSCAYPGLFHPVEYEGRHLIDGAFSMEMPVAPLRAIGATRVIAVKLAAKLTAPASNVFELVNRCFYILRSRTEAIWRSECDLVIEPDAEVTDWYSFDRAQDLIAAGERAALGAVPAIREWFSEPATACSTVATGLCVGNVALYHTRVDRCL